MQFDIDTDKFNNLIVSWIDKSDNFTVLHKMNEDYACNITLATV